MKMVLEKKRRRIEGGFFAYWESHPLKLKDASQAETNGPKKEKTAKRDLQKKFMALWKRNPGVEEKRNLKWEKMGFCFHNSLNKRNMDENVFYLLYRLLRRIQGEGGVQLEDIFAPSEGEKELFFAIFGEERRSFDLCFKNTSSGFPIFKVWRNDKKVWHFKSQMWGEKSLTY